MKFLSKWFGLLNLDGSVYAVSCPECSEHFDYLVEVDTDNLDPIKKCVFCEVAVGDYEEAV